MEREAAEKEARAKAEKAQKVREEAEREAKAAQAKAQRAREAAEKEIRAKAKNVQHESEKAEAALAAEKQREKEEKDAREKHKELSEALVLASGLGNLPVVRRLIALRADTRCCSAAFTLRCLHHAQGPRAARNTRAGTPLMP